MAKYATQGNVQMPPLPFQGLEVLTAQTFSLGSTPSFMLILNYSCLWDQDEQLSESYNGGLSTRHNFALDSDPAIVRHPIWSGAASVCKIAKLDLQWPRIARTMCGRCIARCKSNVSSGPQMYRKPKISPWSGSALHCGCSKCSRELKTSFSSDLFLSCKDWKFLPGGPEAWSGVSVSCVSWDESAFSSLFHESEARALVVPLLRPHTKLHPPKKSDVFQLQRCKIYLISTRISKREKYTEP